MLFAEQNDSQSEEIGVTDESRAENRAVPLQEAELRWKKFFGSAIWFVVLKALINEDTLLRTHCYPWCFLGCANRETLICCGHKMFLNKIGNTFCVPDTKIVTATTVALAGKRGNICVGNNVSATMYPRLPGPLRVAQKIAHARSPFTVPAGLWVNPSTRLLTG